MSADRKSMLVNEANMLSVGDTILMERNSSSDSRAETTVLRIAVNGKQMEVDMRNGSAVKGMVVSLRKGGVWQVKGQSNLRTAYSIYKLVTP